MEQLILSTPSLFAILPTKGHQSADSTSFGRSLVLIPGLGTPPVEQWGVVGLKWWIPEGAPNTKVRFVTYDYQIPVDHKFQWETLLAEGEKLLEALIDDRKGHEVCQTREPGWFRQRRLTVVNVKERKSPLDVYVSQSGRYNPQEGDLFCYQLPKLHAYRRRL